MLDKIKGYRTLGFNGLMVAAGVLAWVNMDARGFVGAFVSEPGAAGRTIAVLGLANCVLRILTTSPWGTR